MLSTTSQASRSLEGAQRVFSISSDVFKHGVADRDDTYQAGLFFATEGWEGCNVNDLVGRMLLVQVTQMA